MSDYTPTTNEIQATWMRYRGAWNLANGSEAQFNRWLEQVKQEARAEAWDEGYGEQRECCGICPSGACPWDNNKNGPTNPYRKEQDQ